MPPPMIDFDEMQALVAEALGSKGLIDMTRLAGGTKKGVHRLLFDDASSVVLYVWSDDDDLWPESDEDPADPFSRASGCDLFEASNRIVTDIGVRTPRVLHLDRQCPVVRGDLALVEDVRGRSLDQLLATDPKSAVDPMSELNAALGAMSQVVSRQLGKVSMLRDPSDQLHSRDQTSERMVLERAIADLNTASGQIEALSRRHSTVRGMLHTLAGQVAPRPGYSLVHGELGPDHVLVDREGRAFLIDIEGLMYFDVEWEHAFLKIRFTDHYRALHRDDLDEDRMALYELALHLSLVAGPLRLLTTGFPQRDLMQQILDWNLNRVLDLTR